MYLKQTILACLLATLSQGVLADQLKLKAGYPETYVVQKAIPSGIFPASIWQSPGYGQGSGTSTRRSPIPTGSTRATCCT